MKKMSKLIALLLALVMLLSCLTACGKKEAPAVEEPAKTEEPKKEEPKAEEPKKEEAAPADEPYLPLVKDGSAKLTIGLSQHANVVDYDTNDYTLWLEEQTGIDLEFVYFSNDAKEAGQQLALMMNAGEKLPDILWKFSAVDLNAANEYGEDGYFLDLKPLIEEYGRFYTEMRDSITIEADSKNLEIYATNPNDGAIYAMPSYQISAGGGDLVSNHPMINKAWLDKLGEEVPKTVDDLVRVLTRFVSEDPNGNGVRDELGMTGIIKNTRGNVLEYVINAYIFNEDTYMYNIDADGNITLPYAADEYRQAMIKLNEMYEAGLIAPVSFTMSKTAEIIPIFTPADGVSIGGVVSGHPTNITADEGWNAFEYVGLPALQAETDLGGYVPIRSATFNFDTYITEDCEDPALAFKFIDFMYSEESILRQRYGKLGTDWEWAPAGMKNQNGKEAKVLVHDAQAYSGQNNKTWHVLGCYILEYAKYPSVNAGYDPNVKVEDMDFAGQKSAWQNKEVVAAWYTGAQKEDVFYKAVYNAEENEAVAEYSKNFLAYVEEARALFTTGTLDPNSDADWEQYLSNLEASGMSALLEATQSAVNRMNGK